MSIFMQIFLGSVILALCSGLHVTVLVATVSILRREFRIIAHWHRALRAFVMLGIGFAAVVLAHTIQVWIWAFALLIVDAFQSFGDAIYFSVVTSTTVGYGDLTLGPDFRIFGAFAGVTGLLTFGLSTGILVGLFDRLLSRREV